MNRFEQLIEYVINDEDAKARELFHDIVVAKSREIYENLMQEEADEDLEEGMGDELEEGMNDELEEGMGGDASDDLIDNIEADEEQDMSMEGEEDFGDEEPVDHDEFGGDHDMDNMGGPSDHDADNEPASKDDILNLEDKLDQLMAEFEGLMGGEGHMGDGDDFGSEQGGDAIEMDDTGEMDENNGMFEAVSLKAAPKPVTSEEGGVNKKSTVSPNSGAKGPIGNTVKPVHAGANEGGHHDSSAYKNSTKDLIGRVGNTPAQGTQNLKPSTKPTTGQASGVNTKSPVARS
jgi:hypothetical protein